MAGGGITCQFCESKGAQVLMTWLSNGASVAACEDDLAPALINVLAVDLGVDPGKFYDHVKRFVDKAAKQAASEAEKGTPSADASEQAPGTGELTPPGDAQDGDAEKYWPGKVYGDDDSVVIP